MARVLSDAETRREAVLNAAVHEFARAGFRGTPVTDVAKAAGISQAYVFRLFPTKTGLFLAALWRCFERIEEAMRAAVEDAPAAEPGEILAAMGEAYAYLIVDRDLIMLQVHALAAVDEPEIRAAYSEAQARIVEFVRNRSGASQPDVQTFFARGLLCHLVAALGIDSVDAPWATTLTDGLVHFDAP